MSIGLVLEGGGMRGAYSAGVLTALHHTEIPVDYVIGVSAGALNAMSYLSGQPERNLSVFRDYAGNEQFVSPKNLIKRKSLFDYEFIVKTLSTTLLPLDFDAIRRSPKRFFAGATDCQTGETVWFPKDEVVENLDILIASSSLPIVAPIVRYKGHMLLDGGIASPIPIDRSLRDGNTKNIIVLTRNAGYRNSARFARMPAEAAYRDYPNLIETMVARPQIYNASLDLCELLEARGDAVIIRPGLQLEVERYERNATKLVHLYHEGVSDAIALLPRLRELTK